MDQVEVCVAAICAKQVRLMCMHLFEKIKLKPPKNEGKKRWTRLRFVLQPSVRNKLGSKALKFLKKGRPVDDQIVVDILADAIK